MNRIDRFKNKFRGVIKKEILITVGSALFIGALLLSLGMTQFASVGVLAQDCFAVPPNTLDSSLRAGDVTEDIILEDITMGDEIFVRTFGDGEYYIGADHRVVSASYPLFTESGKVLYFLDDSLKLITSQWETLTTYENLYLSKGTTFNADRSQADIDEISLVQVDGGYMLAQEMTVTTKQVQTKIPMNTPTSFGSSNINYFEFQKGVLSGHTIEVTPESIITIGSKTYTYLEFLEKLGLWEEKSEKEPKTEEVLIEEPPVVPEKEKNTPKKQEAAPSAEGSLSESQPILEEQEQPVDIVEKTQEERTKKEREPKEKEKQESQTRPEQIPESPAGPVPNPDETPETPEDPEPVPDPNPGFQVPEVSFDQGIKPWVYTLAVKAHIKDEGAVLTSGVQIFVYEVKPDGKTVQTLRRIINEGGEVILGQLRPDQKYKIVAEYKYKDKLNYPQEVKIEIGQATTLPFDQVGTIDLGFYDETSVPVGGAEVEVFGKKLQLRDVVLNNVKNGIVTVPGGASESTATNLNKAETYINKFHVLAKKANESSTVDMLLESTELKALRNGYTLSHLETKEKLSSSSQYTYDFKLEDRYGNQFVLAGKTQGVGHTSKIEPEVMIMVPSKTNVANSTRLEITLNNPDNVLIDNNPNPESVTKGQVKAGLYIVKKGDVVSPENAIDLEGYAVGSENTPFSGKFAPITINSSGEVTTVKTDWVITNLPVMEVYTAAVVCGFYDSVDNKFHYDETIKTTTDFLTASLANLGAISYTAEVDQIADKTARLKFRMNEADERLVSLVDEITFEVKKKGFGGEAEKLTLQKEDLEKAVITPVMNPVTGRYEGSAEAEILFEGQRYPIQFQLDAAAVPTLSQEPSVPGNVWQYIMKSSTTVAADDFWVCLKMGEKFALEDEPLATGLFDLKPSTDYVGNFKTAATQGGKQVDVTSSAGKPVYFTMAGEEALVVFSNEFVSTDFIELYNLSINDVAQAVLPDDADRGGNNVHLRVIDQNGVTVASEYMNSNETYESIRIKGLKTNTTYDLVFTAYKYKKGNGGAVELNYDLMYETPRDQTKPTVFTFTTGESVVGDLSLTGVSQLYVNDEDEPTDAIGGLSESDFYFGVLTSGGAAYYYNEEDRDLYLEQVEEKETIKGIESFAKGETAFFKVNPAALFSADIATQKGLQDAWTSRFIEVRPGQKYFFHAQGATSHPRVNFYYEESPGVIKSYGSYTTKEVLDGTIFTVPTVEGTGSVNAGKIKYMRISGTGRSYLQGLYFDTYDEGVTNNGTNLVNKDIAIDEGVALGWGGALERNSLYAYTSDYIPVEAGSYYEIKGMDQNRQGYQPQTGSGGTDGYVYFYDKNYVFIGRYIKNSYTSIVKAPAGSAYVRFNILLNQGAGADPIDRETVSLKPYKKSVSDYFMAKFKIKLSDSSEHQLLRDGKYTLKMYMTATSVKDSEDLATMDYVAFGDDAEYQVTSEDFVDGKLNIEKNINVSKLPPGRGFKAVLTISPESWTGAQVTLDTVYFTTNTVVKTIETLADLRAITLNPAGSYVVVKDIVATNISGELLDANKPFTGTLDFQGHTLDWGTTNGSALFNKIGKGGVVKNLVLNYEHNTDGRETTLSNTASVAVLNYGTIENVVMNYKVNNNRYNYHTDYRYSGGISYINYGVIRNFAIQVESDIRVERNYGIIASGNYGTISTGYVYLANVEDPVTGGMRPARVEHVRVDGAGQVVSTDTSNFALGVGINYTTGVVENIFTLGNIYVQSADASHNRANADFQGSSTTLNPYYETSTLGTRGVALAVGSSQGIVRDVFSEGDRFDYDLAKNITSLMIDRGPALGDIGGRYEATNLTYFSQETEIYSEFSKQDKSIGQYNSRGAYKSLYDYQWHEGVLGKDGSKFNIRRNVESGFYPQVILPEVFPPDVQPKIALPGGQGGLVEIQNNEVRIQGIDQALVTVTVKYPYAGNLDITAMEVVDRNNVKLDCEILKQATVGEGYRVDILLSLPKDQSALADSLYTITGVSWTGGSQSFAGEGGNRVIHTDFSRKISSIEEWKEIFINTTMPIYGSYALGNDLDFSQATSYKDWLVNKNFYGMLDGGKYSEKKTPLTDTLGNPILDEAGVQRTILVRDQLEGMYEISGVGNTDANGAYMASRDALYSGSLMYYMYGTTKNVIFRNFRTVEEKAPGVFSAAANGPYGGVFLRTEEGAKIENAHVRDSVFYAYSNLGGLTGSLIASSVSNSSVRDVQIFGIRSTPTSTHTINMGGIIGSAESGEIVNSFVADISIRCGDVYVSQGAGGIVGYANNTTVASSYSTGSIDVGVGNVGGIAGGMAGNSEIQGNWSTMSVTTVANFTGGILGKHTAGKLHNNYTAGTVITRSLVSSTVHRITSDPAFDENSRFDNYAFQGQYMTYVEDEPQHGESIYQFGVWDKLDGATKLLERSELVQPSLWMNIIGIGAGFDELGEIRPGGAGGDSVNTKVEDGYMPKLVNWEAGQMLYDQPDVQIGYVSSSMLGKVKISDNVATETLTVELALFSDVDVSSVPFGEIADWNNIVVIGGEVNKEYKEDSKTSIGGVVDLGPYTSGVLGRSGRAFRFQVKYGETATEGHYLDSYILTLPTTVGGTREELQVRLSLETPVYKVINSIADWDAFFSNPKYATSFENIKIDWLATSNQGIIDFAGGDHKYNVRVNRLDGVVKNGVYPTIKNINATFTVAGMSFVDQIITQVSKVNFENITLSSTNGSTKYGGTGKGVIAKLYGNMVDVNFKNITIDGGTSSSVGIVGMLASSLKNVTLENIQIQSTGSYVGGLVGQAETTSTIQQVVMNTTSGKNSIVSSDGASVGGIVGNLLGIASDITVDNTIVKGIRNVGGVAGEATGNGGRPAETKLKNVIVGNEAGVDSTRSGATTDPSVFVELKYRDGSTSVNNMYYAGGLVGYMRTNTATENIAVYNTSVRMKNKALNDLEDGKYAYYIGGVAGAGEGLHKATATNCTIESYGGYAGGVSGYLVGRDTASTNNVVLGLEEYSCNLGGVVGEGSVNTSVSANNIIVGGRQIGGVAGIGANVVNVTSIDNVVLGKESVGGIHGLDYSGYNANLYVGSSLNEAGEAAFEKVVDSSILPPYANFAAGTYKGSHILGVENVGGIAGTMTAYELRHSQVGTKVTVEGDDNVGGAVGLFYGYHSTYNSTTPRRMYGMEIGADIYSGRNAGGYIGKYTKSSGSTTLSTADTPVPSLFYSLLFTGNVMDGTNTDPIMPGLSTDGSQMSTVRVYDKSNVHGYDVTDLGTWADAMNPYDAGKLKTTLSVSAEALAEPLFFTGSAASYGGLNISLIYQNTLPMASMYPQQGAPATFANYKNGIANQNLALWLDARNNTGKGYTDEKATTWKDLSSAKNDATLIWNGKNINETLTTTEKEGSMRWNEGSLEFVSELLNNYAEIEKPLGAVTAGDYTVEVVYSYMSPRINGTTSLLGWQHTTGGRGGFNAPINLAGTGGRYRFDNTYIGTNLPETVQTFTRTATFVRSGTQISAYTNGTSAGAPVTGGITPGDDTKWRIGYGLNGTNGRLRVSGVRIYSKALSAEEVAQNAAYDMWYYFGGAMPTGATSATASSITLGADGTVSPQGTYKLLRSEDGSYNGTLVTEQYTGQGLGSRGYYYLQNAVGDNSNIVAKTAPNYGPSVMFSVPANTYYGTLPNVYLPGQEGRNGDGTLHSAEDSLYYGGYRLPDVGIQSRNPGLTGFSMMKPVLSNVRVYSSGIDTINIELDAPVAEDMTYRVMSNEQLVLTGMWPKGQRTVTMTWDYASPFTLSLETAGAVFEAEYGSANFASTVMTYEDDFWYLYGGELYNSDNESVDDQTLVVHLAEGKALDGEGNILNVQDMTPVGKVKKFEMIEEKPLWEGTIMGHGVETFGGYAHTDGNTLDTPMFQKDNRVYTIPPENLKIGSMVLDSYGDSLYTTALDLQGNLIDHGSALVYPETFENMGIFQTSNTLNYNGNIVLVRYNSGLLVAFNYLTGEEIEVFSIVNEDQSFLGYLGERLGGLGLPGFTTKHQQPALWASQYQGEVEADLSLKNALESLKNGTVETGGTGLAKDSEILTTPGDENAVGGGTAWNPGTGKENTASGKNGIIVEGEFTDGTNTKNGEDRELSAEQAEKTDGTSAEFVKDSSQILEEEGEITEAQREEKENLQKKEKEIAEEKESNIHEVSGDPETKSEEEQTVEMEAKKNQEALEQQAQPGKSDVPIKTKFVTVYAADGTPQVYELKALLESPQESVMSEDVYAKELEKMGFETSLLQQGVDDSPGAKGVFLIIATSIMAMLMLLALGFIKKRKFEEPDSLDKH